MIMRRKIGFVLTTLLAAFRSDGHSRCGFKPRQSGTGDAARNEYAQAHLF